MTVLPDRVEFGGRAPSVLDRSVVALTSRMPHNWLGLRLAILLRRISTMRLEYPAGALDVERWGMRLRLHPIDNGCEKNLLFTPQMYETSELAALSREIAEAKAQGRKFVFVDIGANVGLFSMFVAAAAELNTKIIAIEPEAGNFERLLFNIQSNPGVPIRAVRTALGDEPGELVVERLGKTVVGRAFERVGQQSRVFSVFRRRPCFTCCKTSVLTRSTLLKSMSRGPKIASSYHSFVTRHGPFGQRCLS
jgi:FkbM family methyltransferase